MFKFDFSNKETMQMVGKQVIITFTDGNKILGKVIGFTSAKNNNPEVASIDIISKQFDACVSVFENEILTLEIN